MIKSILLMIGLAAADTGHHSVEINKEAYNNINTWNRTPEVVICKSQTIFDKSDVLYVLELWNEPVKKISIKENCNYNIERGKIKIIDGKNININENWGKTDYFFYRMQNKQGQEYLVYTGAIVQLDITVNNIELLIHEMGHAFGYNHYDRVDDIMNTNRNY